MLCEFVRFEQAATAIAASGIVNTLLRVADA
jgi:hypothetical protein